MDETLSFAELDEAIDAFYRIHKSSPDRLYLNSACYARFMFLVEACKIVGFNHLTIIEDDSVNRFRFTKI